MKKKHIDIDDMEAGDDIDWLLAKRLYGGKHNHLWFVKGPRKSDKPQYFGPQFSTSMIDAMTALAIYCKNYRHLVRASYLKEEMEEGPYSCISEIRIAGQFDFLWIRSHAPTMPLAITRMLLKAPLK